MTRYLTTALAVLAVAALMLALYFRGAAAVSADRQHIAEQRADQLDAGLKASEKARAQEHASALKFQSIANDYEQDKADAESNATRLAADLRAERVRLRPEWRCKASVPAATASAGKPDDAEQRRIEGASDLVRLAREWDAKERAYQAILKAERQH